MVWSRTDKYTQRCYQIHKITICICLTTIKTGVQQQQQKKKKKKKKKKNQQFSSAFQRFSVLPLISQQKIQRLVCSVLMSRHKTGFCICENKSGDQLCSYSTADLPLCFCYTDSIIPLLRKC